MSGWIAAALPSARNKVMLLLCAESGKLIVNSGPVIQPRPWAARISVASIVCDSPSVQIAGLAPCRVSLVTVLEATQFQGAIRHTSSEGQIKSGNVSSPNNELEDDA